MDKTIAKQVIEASYNNLHEELKSGYWFILNALSIAYDYDRSADDYHEMDENQTNQAQSASLDSYLRTAVRYLSNALEWLTVGLEFSDDQSEEESAENRSSSENELSDSENEKESSPKNIRFSKSASDIETAESDSEGKIENTLLKISAELKQVDPSEQDDAYCLLRAKCQATLGFDLIYETYPDASYVDDAFKFLNKVTPELQDHSIYNVISLLYHVFYHKTENPAYLKSSVEALNKAITAAEMSNDNEKLNEYRDRKHQLNQLFKPTERVRTPHNNLAALSLFASPSLLERREETNMNPVRRNSI